MRSTKEWTQQTKSSSLRRLPAAPANPINLSASPFFLSLSLSPSSLSCLLFGLLTIMSCRVSIQIVSRDAQTAAQPATFARDDGLLCDERSFYVATRKVAQDRINTLSLSLSSLSLNQKRSKEIKRRAFKRLVMMRMRSETERSFTRWSERR